MLFSDEGYIIKTHRHGESSLIVTVLSFGHGKLTGYVKGGVSKKQSGVFQPGNRISFNAYARLEENMPQFRGVELVRAHAVAFMTAPEKLSVLSAFCEVMNMAAPEKADLEFLVSYIKDFMDGADDPDWLAKYAFVEFYLLEYLGIGLDLEKCAATGTTENLAFVSPKSGKAVSYEAGLPYADRLFRFPRCVVDKTETPDGAEVAELLRLTGYFLNKNFFESNGLKFPANRANLLHILNLTEK